MTKVMANYQLKEVVREYVVFVEKGSPKSKQNCCFVAKISFNKATIKWQELWHIINWKRLCLLKKVPQKAIIKSNLILISASNHCGSLIFFFKCEQHIESLFVNDYVITVTIVFYKNKRSTKLFLKGYVDYAKEKMEN